MASPFKEWDWETYKSLVKEATDVGDEKFFNEKKQILQSTRVQIRGRPFEWHTQMLDDWRHFYADISSNEKISKVKGETVKE